MRDEAEFVDTCDQSSNETHVDEGDEECIARGSVVGEECTDSPSGGQNRDDEEDEDVVWSKCIVACVDVDEVSQHAESGNLRMLVSMQAKVEDRAYQSDDLEEAPKGEEDGEQHRGGFVLMKIRSQYGTARHEPSGTMRCASRRGTVSEKMEEDEMRLEKDVRDEEG